MSETSQNVKYNNGVSFHCFKSIIEQFDPECPQLEVAALYRLAWIAGNNSVTLDSFLIAAHERNFFIRNMKVEGVYDLNDMEFFKSHNLVDQKEEILVQLSSK